MPFINEIKIDTTALATMFSIPRMSKSYILLDIEWHIKSSAIKNKETAFPCPTII